MNTSNGIGEFLLQSLTRAKALDGKIIGEDSEIIKTELAKTDKGAWVNHLTEQYLKHESLDTPPDELNIVTEDIVEEIFKREINKIFGK